jgi:hypothetical protein
VSAGQTLLPESRGRPRCAEKEKTECGSVINPNMTAGITANIGEAARLGPGWRSSIAARSTSEMCWAS